MRLTFPGLLLALATVSPACNASCWESGAGSTAVYRHPAVRADFKNAALVVIGRVTGERNISEPDDPQGYAWTIYTVEVLETFKGTPQRTIRLVSENTTARFPMDTGKTYLLFVSQFRVAEMAGQERLPQAYVDDCGNSAIAKDAAAAIEVVRDLSKVR
jgi:hypothetical protein